MERGRCIWGGGGAYEIVFGTWNVELDRCIWNLEVPRGGGGHIKQRQMRQYLEREGVWNVEDVSGGGAY